jgi:hypothetical protein
MGSASSAWRCSARALASDAAPDSDYDVAVFLREAGSQWEESGWLAEIETDILFDTRAVINALPFPAAEYHARTPLCTSFAATAATYETARNFRLSRLGAPVVEGSADRCRSDEAR